MITVTCAIIRKDNFVLITRRKNSEANGGLWEFPGGKVELGESLQECLEREIKEELNVDCIVKDIFFISDFQAENGHLKLIALECEILSHKLSLTVHDDAKWVEVDHLLEFRLAPADIPIAKELQNY